MKSHVFFPVICALSLLGGAGCKSFVDPVGDGDDGDGGSGAGSTIDDADGGNGGDDTSTTTSTPSVDNGCAPDDAPTSTPEIVVTGKAGAIAVDDAWLFVVGAEPVPYRVPLCGGLAEPVVPLDSVGDAASSPLVALDATHVYWTVYQNFPFFALWRAPKTGGVPEKIFDEVGPNSAVPAAIAVDDAFVYVTQPDIYNTNNGLENLEGVVRRIPKTGGPAEEIAQEFSYTVAVDGSSVYWGRFNVDGTGSVMRANKDGSGAGPLVTELGPVDGFATAGNRLFWTYSDAGSFFLRTSQSGSPALTLGTTDTYVGTPAVTSDAMYWLRPGDANGGAVFRLGTDATLSKLTTSPASPNAPLFYGAYGPRVAVNSTGVYWAYEGAAGGAPRVYRIAR